MKRTLPVVLAACALAACVEQSSNPASSEAAAARPAPGRVEHWTVTQGDYSLTFYPGFASRAVIRSASGGSAVELYRQVGSFGLPEGSAASGEHLITLRGGRFNRDITFAVRDPKHEMKRFTVHLYDDRHMPGAAVVDQAVEVLEVHNEAKTCPPDCEVVSVPVAANRSLKAPAAAFVAPGFAPRSGRTGDFEISVDPSFASRAMVHGGGMGERELYRQEGVFRLPASALAPAAEHQIRFTGGPGARNLTVQVRDPKHHLARVEVEFYGPSRNGGETGVVGNAATTCPPTC
jgi:hypothetical protein